MKNGMKENQRNVAILVSVLSLTLLNGCGGGGNSSPAASNTIPQRLYLGSSTYSPFSLADVLILENGSYYALYGQQFNAGLIVAGFFEGTGSGSNGVFSSTNPAEHISLYAYSNGSFGGSYVPETSVDIDVQGFWGTGTFSTVKPANTTYNYASAANINDVAGSWSLSTIDGAGANMIISTNGTFTATATSNGCSYSGTISPRPSGKNVFDITLTYGAAPCALPNLSISGIAVSYMLSDGIRREFIMSGTDSSRANGYAASGWR
ncbi:MAG TPA: hypothetical protein VIH22_04650 [Cyclobacteriaceae bacterium]